MINGCGKKSMQVYALVKLTCSSQPFNSRHYIIGLKCESSFHTWCESEFLDTDRSDFGVGVNSE